LQEDPAAARHDEGAGTQLVTISNPMGIEHGESLRADAPVLGEHLAIARADLTVQLDKLDEIDVALAILRPFLNEDLRKRIDTAISETRTQLTCRSPTAGNLVERWSKLAPLLIEVSKYCGPFLVNDIVQAANKDLVHLVNFLFNLM
jgi:hypothetical protein